jgi:small subunit ribosomal protein S21
MLSVCDRLARMDRPLASSSPKPMKCRHFLPWQDPMLAARQRKKRNEDRRRNGSNVQVLVRDNNVDQALRALKKKLQREGVFREMKLRNFYEKPSEKRAREKAEAVRRARKLARKRLQREGLIAVKPRVVK